MLLSRHHRLLEQGVKCKQDVAIVCGKRVLGFLARAVGEGHDGLHYFSWKKCNS
jgi:hypothetical protein